MNIETVALMCSNIEKLFDFESIQETRTAEMLDIVEELQINMKSLDSSKDIYIYIYIYIYKKVKYGIRAIP
jgi:hypothetical protein